LGHPLPPIFPVLDQAAIKFRRGQVALIVGQPNAGKSLLALHYAVKHNLPTLFFSADTDEITTAHRAAAMLTGEKVDDIERRINNGWADHYEQVLDELDNVRFCFNPSPTLDDIDLEIMAFDETWGRTPELVIVDNLMNVVAEHDNEFAGMREIAKAFHHIARESQASVIVLHHTSEAEGNPSDPPARRAIMGKISQLPELILAVAMNPMNGEYKVACVKNRSGPQDATGRTFHTLYVDPSRMQLFGSWDEAAAKQPGQQGWGV
jgi:replicative DNA helicase